MFACAPATGLLSRSWGSSLGFVLVGCVANADVAPPSSEGPPQAGSAGPAALGLRGVVVVSLDTVRADAVEPGGAPAGRSPTLAALAAESVVFERAYAPSNETLFSHASLFTGRWPSHIAPVTYDLRIPDGMPTLAGSLLAEGWSTGAFVGSGQLARVFGLDDGFGTYVEGGQFGSLQETAPLALRWIDAASKEPGRFLAFIHGYDAHTPYLKPGPFSRSATPGYDGPLLRLMGLPRIWELAYDGALFPALDPEMERNGAGMSFLGREALRQLQRAAADPAAPRVKMSPEDRAFALGLYQTGVLYADLWLGVITDELERMGLLDQVLLVVVSDHGEGLFDHGVFTHRMELRDSVGRVVTLLRFPHAASAGLRVSTPISLTDLTPTLLGAVGAPIPAGLDGEDVLPCVRGPCSVGHLPYSEGALEMVSITDGRYRLLVDGVAAADPRLDQWLQAPLSASPVGELRGGAGAGEGPPPIRASLYDEGSSGGPDLAGDPVHAPRLEALRAAMATARGSAAAGAVAP